MKKFISIIAFYLFFTYPLMQKILQSNALMKREVQKKQRVSLILNFDEGGDWIIFNGNSKEFSGRQDNGLGTEITSIEITKDKISYFKSVESMDTHMQIIINRFDGSMYQYGKLKVKI